MIRIEILFDRQSTKNLKSGTLQALQNEIEQRLKPHYPEIWLLSFGSRGFDVLRGPAFCSLRYSPSPV
ncbi:hypothetical protein [Escherichia coli]|uniref:hypothetical protein n=1 Tax=Escherichia coli TaxID=562 RepID=UPI0024AE2E78|nr:hypothetical protein [Escherichia coli]WHG81932.1 hypothetical protein QDW95_23490 [Escherichia coli]